MSKEKKMNRFNRFKNFIKKFPTLVVLVVLVPSIITTFRFLGSLEDSYENLYYYGPDWLIKEDTFKITGIKKRTSVYQTSSLFSYQGAACYENYYAICADSFESILIYDTDNLEKGPVHIINTGTIDSYWHCNQIFFGPEFYSAQDKFPLLYVSMEHKDIISTYVFRIYKLGVDYKVAQVQRLQLEFDDGLGTLYYPNSYMDFDDYSIIYAGYTKNSYMKSDDNLLRYYRFNLPDHRIERVKLKTSESIEMFELPSETATQGGFINCSHLYQMFSFDSKTDPLRTPKLRVVDIMNHTIVHQYDDLYKDFGIAKEFEHLVVDKKGRLFTVGNPFTIYEVEYSAEPIIKQ